MSADNYILMIKEKNMWTGYLESASVSEPRYNVLAFRVGKIMDAIDHAQNTDTEYGMRFLLEEDLEGEEIQNANYRRVN